MPKLLTQEQVEKRLKDIGVLLLDKYINIKTSLSLRCDCGHEWKTRPYRVWSRQSNCPACASIETTNKLRLPEVIVLDRLKQNGIELLEPYKDVKTNVLIRCALGHEWKAKLNNIFNGTGCPKCSKRKPVTKDEAIERYRSLGLELLEPYKTAHIKILARCNKCNKEWASWPSGVFKGQGCPQCGPGGFQKDKAGTLYYIRVDNPFGDPVYKIGITNLTLRERFRSDFPKVTVIETWAFPNGAEAFEMEQDILNDYAANRYDGPDLLECGGNAELFKIDVLCLDRSDAQLALIV